MDTMNQSLNPLAMLTRLSQQMPQMQQQYGNALSNYTTQSQQSNDELIKQLQAQQGGNMSSPLMQLGAALLSPTRTGSFGESMGMGAQAFDKANTQGRNDLLDRAMKINQLRQASAKFGLDAAGAQMGMMKDQIGLASTAQDLMSKQSAQQRAALMRKQYTDAVQSMPDLLPQERNLLLAMEPEEGIKFLNERGKMDSVDKKAVLEKTDELTGVRESLDMGKSVLAPQVDPKTGKAIPGSSLNERSNSGYTSTMRAAIGRNLPTFVSESGVGKTLGLDKDSQIATTMVENFGTAQILPLAKTLGANPSNKDSELLAKLQALSSYSPEERKAIIEEATRRSREKERRLISEREGIKDKSIYRRGAAPQGQGGGGGGDPLAAGRAAIAAGASREAVIQRLKENGISVPEGF
jgi:hypothetical protein